MITHKWNFNQFEVFLTQNLDELKYETREKTTWSLVSHGPIDLCGVTVSKMIDGLKKCQAIVNVAGKTDFFHSYKKWNLIDKEISLLKGNDLLLWHIFFTSTQKNLVLSFQDTIPSERCHPNTIALVDKIKSNSLTRDSIEVLIKNFKITRIIDDEILQIEEIILKYQRNLNPFIVNLSTLFLASGSIYASSSCVTKVVKSTSEFFGGGYVAAVPSVVVGLYFGAMAASFGVIPIACKKAYDIQLILKELKKRAEQNQFILPNENKYIEIEPISMPSKLDERVLVSKFTWAVTMITGPKGASKNHAAIVIEGLANDFFRNTINNEILDGEYFMFKSEINPPIVSYFYHENVYRSDCKEGIRRSEIWMRQSDKVIQMLENIDEEKNSNRKKRESGQALKFNSTGRKSIFFDEGQKGGPSCFDWAREHLETLDITIGTGNFESISVWPRSFTRSFQDYNDEPFNVQI
ncbi:MAG: hypothetical protein Q8K60_04715 [Parachlamydiaceae bacterium]|nr:hypothetical protein [Parachlamydiaceae bacterium]